MLQSIQPATGELIKEYTEHNLEQANSMLAATAEAQKIWRDQAVSERVKPLNTLAELLEAEVEKHAHLIVNEMGKPVKQAEAEIKKCALLCRYYAENGPGFLADEIVETEGKKSYVAFQPLGNVLGVMPWNFPYWQVFRFAVPAMCAGNGAVLKHASNVTGCALAIETLFLKAGFPKNLFQTLLLQGKKVEALIESPQIHAVTLTGSEGAGKAVAEKAGKMLKKTVLELGGSDPFLVLDDAPLEAAAKEAVMGRLLNGGQSCIAAKRFLIVASVYDAFVSKLLEHVKQVKWGDPTRKEMDMGPLVRGDLREVLHKQVEASVKQGARLLLGGNLPEGKGFYYPPTILEGVQPGMPAFDEETFGPLFALIKVKDEQEALKLANQSCYGLGGCVWTRDLKKGEAFALKIESGTVVVNGVTHSDPKLPFGGVKLSGYGRELSHFGIREFVNIKTISIYQSE